VEEDNRRFKDAVILDILRRSAICCLCMPSGRTPIGGFVDGVFLQTKD
jgi:hypothetical protein